MLRLIDWSVDVILDWLIDRLIDWLTRWFVKRSIDWLIDWCSVGFSLHTPFLFLFFLLYITGISCLICRWDDEISDTERTEVRARAPRQGPAELLPSAPSDQRSMRLDVHYAAAHRPDPRDCGEERRGVPGGRGGSVWACLRLSPGQGDAGKRPLGRRRAVLPLLSRSAGLVLPGTVDGAPARARERRHWVRDTAEDVWQLPWPRLWPTPRCCARWC